jgi:hypothetical protein
MGATGAPPCYRPTPPDPSLIYFRSVGTGAGWPAARETIFDVKVTQVGLIEMCAPQRRVTATRPLEPTGSSGVESHASRHHIPKAQPEGKSFRGPSALYAESRDRYARGGANEKPHIRAEDSDRGRTGGPKGL